MSNIHSFDNYPAYLPYVIIFILVLMIAGKVKGTIIKIKMIMDTFTYSVCSSSSTLVPKSIDGFVIQRNPYPSTIIL